jgi:hypothetical protein
MRSKPEMVALKAWLKTHHPTELAARLGYKSSTTISHWINKNRIPSQQISRVMEIIKESNDVRQSNEG